MLLVPADRQSGEGNWIGCEIPLRGSTIHRSEGRELFGNEGTWAAKEVKGSLASSSCRGVFGVKRGGIDPCLDGATPSGPFVSRASAISNGGARRTGPLSVKSGEYDSHHCRGPTNYSRV